MTKKKRNGQFADTHYFYYKWYKSDETASLHFKNMSLASLAYKHASTSFGIYCYSLYTMEWLLFYFLFKPCHFSLSRFLYKIAVRQQTAFEDQLRVFQQEAAIS